MNIWSWGLLTFLGTSVTGIGDLEPWVSNPFTQGIFSAPIDWCEHGLHGALKKTIDQFAKDMFFVSLDSEEAASLGVSRENRTTEGITVAMEKVLRELDLIETSTYASSAVSSLERLVTLQSMLSFFELLKEVVSIFKQPGDGKFTKLEHLAAAFCRVVDKEWDQLKGRSPTGCFGQNLAVTVTSCSGSLRSNIPDYEDCEGEGALQQPEDIPGFPIDEDCFSSSLGRFRFSNPNLVIPMDLVNQTFVADVPEHVREEEMVTYLAVWRAAVIFYRYANPKCLKYNERPVFIPGWKVVSSVHLTQLIGKGGSEMFPHQASVPYAEVMLPNTPTINPCKVVVLFRGSQTDYEWESDFYYHSYPIGRNQTAHFGYMKLIAGLLDDLNVQIQAATKNCSCEETEIIFSGHSLGAGIAIITSTLFQNKLDQAKCPATVYSVAISSPRVLSDFNPRVRYRYLIDRKDMLYSFPCFNGLFRGEYEGNGHVGWPRCSAGHAVVPGEGRDNFPTPWGRIVANSYLNANLVETVNEQDKRNYRTSQKYPEIESVKDGAVPSPWRSALSNPMSLLQSIFPSQVFSKNITHVWSQSAKEAFNTLTQHLDLADMMYYVPARQDLIVGHLSSLSCGLSSACRVHPASKFVWRCDYKH